MLNARDILETITMIQDEHLDVRTITMGISLLDCCHSDVDVMCQRVYDKITRYAKDLVVTGEGRIDFQTAMGKAPIGVARMAKKYGKKAFCWAIED